jgi:hypothetical protein
MDRPTKEPIRYKEVVGSGVWEDPAGEYVGYQDYEVLREENAKLRAQAERVAAAEREEKEMVGKVAPDGSRDWCSCGKYRTWVGSGPFGWEFECRNPDCPSKK